MENNDLCLCNNKTIALPGDFARTLFQECLYTTADVASFFIGLSSILFWLLAQTPQFTLNCRLGRARGLSVWFLLAWLVADTINLFGAVLTGQVGTTLSIAGLFVVALMR